MGIVSMFCDVDFEYLDSLNFCGPFIFAQQQCAKIECCVKKGYFCISGVQKLQ